MLMENGEESHDTYLNNIRPRQPWVQLPLPDADLSRGALTLFGFDSFDIRFQLLHVVDAVVADAERADLARLLGFNEGAPGAEAGVLAAIWGVDQVPAMAVLISSGSDAQWDGEARVYRST